MTMQRVARRGQFLVCLLLAAQATAQEGPAEQNSRPAAERLLLGRQSQLKYWSVAKQYDFANHGGVAFREGALWLGRGEPATGVVYRGPLPRSNYELRLEAQRTAGNDFFCGLTFPVQDAYCTLIIGGWGGGTTGLSNIDNVPAVENETANYLEVTSGRWYTVRLRVATDRIQAWIDDERMVDLDPRGRKLSIWWEQEPMRPLGIATWNTAAAIRNVRLQQIEQR